MPGHSFYISPENISTKTAIITSEESYHLQKVLRLKVGEQIRVFDGLGNNWIATIEYFKGQEVYLKLLELLEDIFESPLKINLAQGLIKGDKFEWVIQKAVELGVSTIQPLITRYTDVKVSKGHIENRLERWERIVLEATKQSGRSLLTQIFPPVQWSTWIEKQKNSPVIFFNEAGSGFLSKIIIELKEKPINSITLIIGSEGGWSENEVLEASQAGFYLATLGKRILRAETAGITAVALIQHLLGDLT